MYTENVRKAIITLAPTTFADELYTMFQEALKQGTKDHIPTITIRKGCRLPFIDKKLQKLIAKRDEAFAKKQKKRQSNHSNSHHTRELDDIFQNLKHQIQKELHQVYCHMLS